MQLVGVKGQEAAVWHGIGGAGDVAQQHVGVNITIVTADQRKGDDHSHGIHADCDRSFPLIRTQGVNDVRGAVSTVVRN